MMPKPFMVMATQNPIEYEGTFPLPEAQLDRFFLRISMGYLTAAAEVQILEMQQQMHPVDTLTHVAVGPDADSPEMFFRNVRFHRVSNSA